MVRNNIARKVEWGITPISNVLFEKTEYCWKIAQDYQTVRRRVNGRWTLKIVPIDSASLGCRRDAWLGLDRDMISIADKARIDALLNLAPHFPQDRMSTSIDSEAATPEVVEIQTDDSSNTSEYDSSGNNNGVSDGEENNNEVGSKGGTDETNEVGARSDEVETIIFAVPITTLPALILIPVAQAYPPVATSFENLTVRVAT